MTKLLWIAALCACHAISSPLVLQLDRLTNDQLVGIIRAADPMASP